MILQLDMDLMRLRGIFKKIIMIVVVQVAILYLPMAKMVLV